MPLLAGHFRSGSPRPAKILHSSDTGNPRQTGFTLVEIMVVVVIIGLLATLVVPAVMGRKAEADVNKAKADLAAIYSVATTYAITNSSIPTMEDLLMLDSHGHPYLEGEEPVDPWGNQYVIRELDGTLRFEVVSFGYDKNEDTEDDMVHPARKDR